MERRGLPMLNHVLQHTLRSLCTETQWVYAVFWRILPRNYPPPKWETEGGPVDRSKGNKRNWILVWEDGFCDFPACSSAMPSSGREAQAQPGGARYGSHSSNQQPAGEDSSLGSTVMHPDLFFKMSHEVYNYGEGLMGKVAADNSHKWVYREPMEHEISFLSPWHGSLDPHPRTWEAQFKAGIQTIAVISVREGLIQLGSTRKVVEDLNLVILMQRKFNYLQSIPGVFVPHPSPLASGKRRADGSGIMDGSESPPMESLLQQHHGSSPYQPPFLRSNSDPYRLTGYSRQFGSAAGVVGMKRPADNDMMGNPSNRDFPFLSPGINYVGGARFDPRQANNIGQLSLDSPSSPKSALLSNSGLSPGSMSLLPSMSSLHNLLSKLPSVTTTLDSNPAAQAHSLTTSPLLLSGLTVGQATMQGLSSPPPTAMTTSPRASSSAAGPQDHSSSSPSSSRQQLHSGLPDSAAQPASPQLQPLELDLQQQRHLVSDLDQRQHVINDLDHNLHQQLHLDPQQLQLENRRLDQLQEHDMDRRHQQHQLRDLDGNHHQRHLEPDLSHRQQQQQHELSELSCTTLTTSSQALSQQPFSSLSELFEAAAASRGGAGSGGPARSGLRLDRPPPQAGGGPPVKDKLTSFLDSFDQDTLTDLGLHDDLENSETYNSFLSEIS